MPNHATYPPSKLSHWEICPGWENEPFESNAAAEEGTMLHKACETRNISNLNEEQAQIVNQCLDYVNSISAVNFMSQIAEFKLNVAGLTWGTADKIIYHTDNTADIIDFKFGRTKVEEAETNIQGWCYALGVFTEAPMVHQVTVHFLCPRQNEITTHTFTREDIMKMELRIKCIIAMRKDYEQNPKDEVLKATPTNCTYCGRKASCSKLHEIALRTAKGYDTTFDVPQEYHASQITDPRKMSVVRDIADIMGKWASSVKEHSTQMVLRGENIPGWKLMTRQGSVEIKDAQAAYITAKEICPTIENHEYMAVCSVSKTALSDLIKDKSPRGQKQRNAELVNAKLIGDGHAARGAEVHYLVRERE